uniref:Odorant receptor n=1 Tax=Anomala corpulenta TaxID=931571 RepID=A0A0E3U2K1_9SCAR|nr:odorant receptor 17 [Anomala corpulenta]
MSEVSFKSQKVAQYDTIDVSRKILWAFGVYTGKKYPNRILCKISLAINCILTFTFMISMLINILLNMDDLETVFVITHLLVTELGYTTKTYYFMRMLKEFNALEELLEEPIFNDHSLEQDNFVAREIRTSKILSNIFRCLSWCAQLTYTICPILDGDIWAIPIWVPLTDGSPKLIYQAYEALCFMSLASVEPALDLIPVGFISTMAAQLDILNDNLKHSADKNEDELEEGKIRKRLAKCVKHHLAILSFLKKLEEIFSFGIFIQIFTSVGAICMSGLQFLVVPVRSATFVAVFIYFWVMVVQIGTCCWVGQTLITKSNQIRDACYESTWYNCNTSTKRIFFIIMERSKKTISFRAGNFFNISLATFVMIIRNSYSYFAVLMQMYK